MLFHHCVHSVPSPQPQSRPPPTSSYILTLFYQTCHVTGLVISISVAEEIHSVSWQFSMSITSVNCEKIMPPSQELQPHLWEQAGNQTRLYIISSTPLQNSNISTNPIIIYVIHCYLNQLKDDWYNCIKHQSSDRLFDMEKFGH